MGAPGGRGKPECGVLKDQMALLDLTKMEIQLRYRFSWLGCWLLLGHQSGVRWKTAMFRSRAPRFLDYPLEREAIGESC